LAQAFKLNPRLINGIILDNNGMSDDALANLSIGLKGLENLKSFIYKRNEMQR
jgi:hypothetical protein